MSGIDSTQFEARGHRIAALLAVPLAVAALLAGPVASAAADGDPASDVLTTQTVFVPADGGISSHAQAQLTAAVQASTRAGIPIRVALIATRADLGSVTELWRRPQAYAQFLGIELSLMYRGPLLVVMPSGAGLYSAHGLTSAQRSALGRMPAPGPGDKLAQTATAEVAQLARAAGHALRTSPPPATSRPAGAMASGGGSSVRWALFVLGAVLIAAAWTASLRAQPLRVPGRRPRAGQR